MAAISQLLINDAQATPVPHTFVHKSHTGSELVLVDSTAGLVAAARPTLSIAKLPSKDRNVRKLRTRVVMPLMETVSGNTAGGYVAEPKKLGESLIISDFVIHNRMSEQGVKDMLVYHRGLVSPSLSMFNDPYQNDQSNY